MADSQTDIRDRILVWLDENEHAAGCYMQHGGEYCDCRLGRATAAIREVMHLHEPSKGVSQTWCAFDADNDGWPCSTIERVADALEVTP